MIGVWHRTRDLPGWVRSRCTTGAHSCRQTRQSCEPAHVMGLTPRSVSRNVAEQGPPARVMGKGARVNRRLIAALMVVASLLGVVQPALASVASRDCCSTSMPAQCGESARFAAVANDSSDCCATRAPVAASSVAISAQPRSVLDRASGPASLAAVPTAFQRALQPVISAPRVPAPPAADQSDTYLRTLRLRL